MVTDKQPRRRRCKECNAMPGLIWDHYQFCSKADGGTLPGNPDERRQETSTEPEAHADAREK